MTQLRLYNNFNFKLHWGVIAISSAGSYFTLVALPWLALGLSKNNPLVVTTLLACSSLPQGFAILFGGGLADRFSAYQTLWLSRAALALALFSLALLTATTVFPLWILYLYAFGLGCLASIATPASQALLPRIVETNDLPKANGVVVTTFQLSQLVGPIAAGWTIWFIKHVRGVPDEQTDTISFAIAFGIEAAALVLATALLSLMRLKPAVQQKGDLVQLIREGIRFCWRDTGIRMVLGYLLLISFFVQGTLLASLPLFTKFNLGLSERAYGTLYGMLGCGTILGAGLAAWLRPAARILGGVVLGCDLTVGLALYSLSRSHSPWTAGAALVLMGIGLGLTAVAGVSWFQLRTPGEYMGRVMSMLMFAVFGMIPISATLTGYLASHFSVSAVMRGASAVIVTFTLIGLSIRSIREMGAAPQPEVEPVFEPESLTALAEPSKGE